MIHIGGDTHASSGSGEINVRDIRGSLNVRAGTGTIRAANINGSRKSQEHKVSLTLADSPAETLTVLLRDRSVKTEIVTGSGDVEIDDVVGGLQVMSGSGAIRVSGNPSADWQLETGSGTVRIMVAESANFALLAHTSSGTIEAHDRIATRDELGPHDFRAKVGKGGPTVNLKTASGNIEIE